MPVGELSPCILPTVPPLLPSTVQNLVATEGDTTLLPNILQLQHPFVINRELGHLQKFGLQ